MAKPSKAIFYLILFFASINALVFSIAQIIISFFGLNLVYSITIVLFLSFLTATIISLIFATSAPIFKEYMATYRRLLRLDNLSHPLLLKMAEEAPGTYYHSLAVANLAYQVAKELELNALLVRVGAYFHDIGKLSDPEFFIENQRGKENPHDKISNLKSAEIIKRHITEGIELAREAGLPDEIVNFIPEHAGTTLISYFYNKALKEEENPKKLDYRNPGPKPRSLETALVMIADSLEAKLRLLPEVTKENAKKTVNEVIENKESENQLSLISLDPKSLKLIKNAFCQAAVDQFHNRIAYPNKNTNTVTKLKKQKSNSSKKYANNN